MEKTPNIIGKGTWLDRVAGEVLEREKRLGRSTRLLRVESGLGASGLPHIGSVGDAIRSFGVKMALENRGYSSELIAYSDDFDGLRKVPAGFPRWLSDYLAQPVSRIPDPFGCHGSYAEHVGSLLRESLDGLGIIYRFQSGTESYRSGILGDQIRKILTSSEAIGKQIKGMVGQSKYEQNLPYTPVCSKCGRIYTTQAVSFDAHRDTVHYRCEGTKLGDKEVKGCGNEGDVAITTGDGKLMWKVEFAARWAALDIRFEAYGKELTDSVRINDWVSENVLGFPAPSHARYELFQDKSGKKLSKSSGNLVTPQEWMAFGSPESLRLLMFKRIVGARSVSLDDIPVYMDEFDDLEESYFSKKRDPNPMKDARLRGLYEYSMLLKTPRGPRPRAPYRLLAQLGSVAPKDNLLGFVHKRLVEYGLAKEGEERVLSQRIEWAAAWARRGGETEPPKVEVPPTVVKAIRQFAQEVLSCTDGEQVQGAAFSAIRSNGLKPADFFPVVYSILLGSDRGPRLGPYVMDAGARSVSEKLLAAAGSTKP